MSKEITITNTSNQSKLISFKLNGLEDGILVCIPDKYPNCITVSYKGATKIVPFNAKTEDIEELNSDENVIKPSNLKESDKITTAFRSVIQEHCFNKGLYAFDDIEKAWKIHVKSLKDAVKSMKNGNN